MAWNPQGSQNCANGFRGPCRPEATSYHLVTWTEGHVVLLGHSHSVGLAGLVGTELGHQRLPRDLGRWPVFWEEEDPPRSGN